MADNDTIAYLAATVDDFLRSVYDADTRRRILSSPDERSSLVPALAELGVFAVVWGEEHGGLGLPPSALGPLFIQYGRHLLAGPMLENSLLPGTVYEHASAEGRKLMADAVENGSVLAFLDPAVSNHWSGRLGSVTNVDSKLYGTFEAVRFGSEALALLVVADRGGNPVLHLIEPTAPGVRIEAVGSADPAVNFSRVTLDGAEGAPVGDAATAPEVLARVRRWSRVLIACELSGIATSCVELAVEYAKQREQFGRVIGSFQAIKHMLADMHTEAVSLHNFCEAVAGELDELPHTEAELSAAALKAHAATVAVTVCEGAIQVHGGIGFTAEADIHWYYKRALALRAWYGDSTELEEEVGALVLDQPTARTVERV
ncbi:acyl-CoA dehydrogenase family protein [Gordonia tangerina]|uniref:Acyl-CoA/acyl-ACP dehydrogenase n=1 Tax=Gordonia tangerina TaxID=2911060 RepID=A0ABS9DQH8_9ACTN|nr:acyl-CoA dehydrogenase family protein [Gordonia tangerina]MCF3941381.1 acyl-CoA/acyl-ACP dehydrogenase [Gordonia tangerina]